VHVTLINPPQVFSRLQVASGITPPLGVASLAAWLLACGHEVAVVDALGLAPDRVTPFRGDALLRGLDLDQTVAAVPERTRLVGVSNLFTFAWPMVEQLVERLRSRLPETPIVVGGPHPAALPEECLRRCPGLDFVVLGEGEVPLQRLCEALESGAGLEGLEAVARRLEDGSVGWTPQRLSLVRDLDELPFPARHLLPMEAYVTTREAHGPVGERWTSLLSSRGCPYGCTFCQSRNTRWRGRSATNVVDEMEECVARWGVREFHFEDDNLTLDRRRVRAIADEILRRGLDVRWQTPNGIRASSTDRETLQAMWDSGCRHITVAPESGSERVLTEVVRKGRDFELEQLVRVARDARGLGMKVAAYFVLGLPGERPYDAEATIALIRRLARVGVDEVGIALFTPLPGTPLWEQLGERAASMDYLDLLAIDDLGRAVSFNEQYSDDELQALRRRAYAAFFLVRLRHHPRALLRTAWNVLRSRQELKTDRVLINQLERLRSRVGTADSRPVLAYPYDAARTLRVLLDSRGDHAFRHTLRKALRTLRPGR